MAVMRRPGREEGKEFAVHPLLVEPVRVALREAVNADRFGRGRRSILQDAPDRLGEGNVRAVLTIPGDRVDPREVAVVRGLGMILLIEAEELPCRAGARRQPGGERLDRGACELMLEPLAWQARAEREGESIAGAKGRAEQLHPVGRKAARAVEASMDNPRIPSALG